MNTTALTNKELVSNWEATDDPEYAEALAARFADLRHDGEERAETQLNLLKTFADSAEVMSKRITTLQELADTLTSDAEELESDITELLEELE